MSDIESQTSSHRRSSSPSPSPSPSSRSSASSSHHNRSKGSSKNEEELIAYGRRFLSRRSSSASSSSPSISLRLPLGDEVVDANSPAKKVTAKVSTSSSSESNIFHHHHRHRHHLHDYYDESTSKRHPHPSSSRALKSPKSPPMSSSSVATEAITPDSAIIPSVRCAFCLPCCLLLCFLLILAIVLVVFLLLNLFQLNFSLPSRWSGQLTFAGTYVFSDAFKSDWSPGTPSNLRRADSLPYELAKAEGERVVIERIGSNHSYSLTASNPSIKGSQASTGEEMLRFTEDIPVEVTRVVDEFQAELARFRVTVSISGADWVESYEPLGSEWRRRFPAKIEVRREFSRDSMTVSYVVGKAVYVKRFEKL